VWHDAFICVTWRIHMCDMTHSYVWHDAFICVTWRIHMCDMTCAKPETRIQSWSICRWTNSHSCVWHHSCISVIWLFQSEDGFQQDCISAIRRYVHMHTQFRACILPSHTHSGNEKAHVHARRILKSITYTDNYKRPNRLWNLSRNVSRFFYQFS